MTRNRIMDVTGAPGALQETSCCPFFTRFQARICHRVVVVGTSWIFEGVVEVLK